jgi:predicted permease
MEKVYRQHISGNLFRIFGLQPAAGRLITANDDVTPGAHPVAVLSYDYWSRRFGRDPAIAGKTFRMGNQQYEIVGVAPKGFTGTHPGTISDMFTPSMMNTAALNSPGWSWFQIWVRPKPGYSLEQVRQPLHAAFTIELRERIKRFDADTPRKTIEAFLSQGIQLMPAASGASEVQKTYRRPLLILGVLVAMVLLIACANTGNLLIAQAAARAREMALRVSIGAGQWRLIQLVLVESALLAALASMTGLLLSWWSAPLVVSMLAPPDDPVRLVLNPDWRLIAFGVALTLAVTPLFGLAPALRASAVKPMSALKGGEDVHSRRRLMNVLVAAQMAFCVLVQFVAGLFVSTFDRLSNRPIGFSHERVLVVDTEGGNRQELADRLRRTAGVESVAQAGWPLLSGNGWTSQVRVGAKPPESVSPYFLDVSTGFMDTMRIGLIDGRDFRPGDSAPRLVGDNRPVAGVGIVNEVFARTYFSGERPLGRIVDVGTSGRGVTIPMEVVGVVRDAVYRNLRDPIRPTVYVPIDPKKGVILLRTSASPLQFAPFVRREVSAAGYRVRNIDGQSALVRRHLIRERLLATLSLFFAIVALVLAGVGLYGVLNYSVVQQKREIGIRLALGARALHVVQRVTTTQFAMVALGSAAGLAAGLASARFVESLLFEVKATDVSSLAIPIAVLFAAAVLAALPPALRAARIDPAQTLRGE